MERVNTEGWRHQTEVKALQVPVGYGTAVVETHANIHPILVDA